MKSLIVCGIILINLASSIHSNNGINTGASWYENLPAVAMDYKVYIDAGETGNVFDLLHYN